MQVRPETSTMFWQAGRLVPVQPMSLARPIHRCSERLCMLECERSVTVDSNDGLVEGTSVQARIRLSLNFLLSHFHPCVSAPPPPHPGILLLWTLQRCCPLIPIHESRLEGFHRHEQ